ncbi:hypothetical protein D9M72_624560 [compost metagenome]
MFYPYNLSVGDAREVGCEKHAHDDDQGHDSRPVNRYDEQRQDDGREGEDHVGQAHGDGFDQPAKVPAHETKESAEDAGEQGSSEGYDNFYLRPIDES